MREIIIAVAFTLIMLAIASGVMYPKDARWKCIIALVILVAIFGIVIAVMGL